MLLRKVFPPPPGAREAVPADASLPSAAHASHPLQTAGVSTAHAREMRPVWRHVLTSVERTMLLLDKQQQDVASLQHVLAQLCHELIPRLALLGAVGVLCQQRLAAFMQEVGLAPGAPQPQSTAAIVLSATQSLSALKRYATSGMQAPAIAPHSEAASEPSAGAADGGQSAQPDVSDAQVQPQPPPACCGDDAATTTAAAEPGSEGAGEGEGGEGDSALRQLHACKNCQRAKTACNDQRPCARCVRLGVPCDGNLRAVKRACSACKRSKVKCDLDDLYPKPCSRCARLGSECTPHVPNKKSKKSSAKDEADDDVPADDSPFGRALVGQTGEILIGGGLGVPPELGGASMAPPGGGGCGSAGASGGNIPMGLATVGSGGLAHFSSDTGGRSDMGGRRDSCRSIRSSLSEGLVNDALACLPDMQAMRSTGSSGHLPLPPMMMPQTTPPRSSGQLPSTGGLTVSDLSGGIDEVVNAILGDDAARAASSSGQLPCASGCPLPGACATPGALGACGGSLPIATAQMGAPCMGASVPVVPAMSLGTVPPQCMHGQPSCVGGCAPCQPCVGQPSIPSWMAMQIGSSSNVVAALSRQDSPADVRMSSNNSLSSVGSLGNSLGNIALPMPSQCGSQASLGSVNLASLGPPGSTVHMGAAAIVAGVPHMGANATLVPGQIGCSPDADCAGRSSSR